MQPKKQISPAVTAYEKLADAIREQIVSGELAPGDQLPTEPELSTYYDVSRNTAREALRLLASQGLLTSRRGVTGGTFVAHPSPRHISDALETGVSLLATTDQVSVSELLEIREMVELPAAELAALRRTDDELEVIRAALFDAGDADPQHIFSSTHAFHTGILRATHNPLLEVVTAPIFQVLRNRILREHAADDFWRDVDHDHQKILGCIEAHDEIGARETMHAHLRYLRTTYEKIDRERQEE